MAWVTTRPPAPFSFTTSPRRPRWQRRSESSADFVAADGTTPVRIGVDATTVFGMDFNPTVDRVRVVNSAGQNFRMNPNNGALVDFDATVAGVQMDGGINGPTMSVQETAYTNSSPNVTVTTQYTMDQTIDAVCIQNPPNNGTQTMCLPLSVPVETVQGFDIPPSVTVTTSATAATGLGTAVVRASGRTQDELVNVNLSIRHRDHAGPGRRHGRHRRRASTAGSGDATVRSLRRWHTAVPSAEHGAERHAYDRNDCRCDRGRNVGRHRLSSGRPVSCSRSV